MKFLLLLVLWIFLKSKYSFNCLATNEKLKCTSQTFKISRKSNSDYTSNLKHEDIDDISIYCEYSNIFNAIYKSARDQFQLICLQDTRKNNYSAQNIIEDITSSIQNLNITRDIFSANDVRLSCYMDQFSSNSYEFLNATYLDLSGNDMVNLHNKSFLNLKIVQDLVLSNNKMENIFNGVLNNLTELHSLTLSNNRLTRLPGGIFLNNLNLTDIMIDFNLLEELPSEIFYPLINLTHVSMKNNKLTTFPINLFSKNFKLVYLDASHNLLQSLDYSVFPNTIDLQFLYLNNNKLKELNLSFVKDPLQTTYGELFKFRNISYEFLLKYLKGAYGMSLTVEIVKRNPSEYLVKTNKLTYLDISHNQIIHFPNNLFESSKLITYVKSDFNKNINNLEGENMLYSLVSLTMVDCNIVKISRNYFKKYDDEIVQIRELILSRNRISRLDVRVLWGFRNLRILLLDHNELTTLSDGFFKDLTALKHLDLSFNKFSTLSMEVFNLRALIRLNLQFNNIENFDNSSFIKSNMFNYIQNLNLSNNCLSSRSANNFLKLCQDLKMIDISYNSLTNITLTSNSIIYNLRYNGIRTMRLQNLHQKAISGYSPKKSILLCPNPVKQICINENCGLNSDIIRTLKEESPNLNVEICEDKTWSVENYYFRNITTCPIDLKCSRNFYKSLICEDENNCTDDQLSYIRCEIIDNCPSSCTCYQSVILQQITVNCSNSNFTSLPDVMPYKTNILYFQNNNLEYLDSLNSSIYFNLIELYLDNNSISTLDNLKLPPRLKKISLRNNKIRIISEDTQRLFTRIKTYLGGNNWKCGCSTLNFKAFLNSPNKIADINDITCEYDQEPIINLSNDILCPEKVLTYLPIWAVFAIVLLILIGMMLTIYYRNKQVVLAYIYTHLPGLFKLMFKDGEVEEDKYYDAFISYSTSDRDVVMSLIEELEEKEPKFFLCIHERDWIPGNPICSNIANSVSSSRRTIIILSEQFLNSIWFPVELHSAYYKMLEDKVNRIIFVLKGHLPPMSTLDKDLQVLLKTKTYLVWGERWFWEKLRLALPHKNHPGKRTKTLIDEEEFL
ncbi:protein toll-like [Centruroides vittatus]|uniref:protein toll-like n=1 Tax=Centruroides vittatus TaxID=120091 RepID=UPI0035104A0F